MHIGGFLATLVPIINALFRLHEGSIVIYGRKISGNALGVELAFLSTHTRTNNRERERARVP